MHTQLLSSSFLGFHSIIPIPNTSMASSSHSNLSSSSSPPRYDVFLSFRGEDVRKTFIDHLYSALSQQGIYTYKDDQALSRGESIGPSLLKAIEESKISVIIFSQNYANSSWCLDELVHIMKCRDGTGQIVFPIFYDVDPSDVRKQKRKYGEAFDKLENSPRVESWRKALVAASNISGWEPRRMANGHESAGIKEIVSTISDKLFSSMPLGDEELVGMGTRSHSLKSKIEIGSGGVRMVGIWGIGGSGKTTLAYSVYTEISKHFDAHCNVDSIREDSNKYGLRSLQEKILLEVLKTKVAVHSVDDGKRKIKSRLGCSKVLFLLDDVDDRKQLEALAGSHKWFGEGSRIIITSRDEHLLITHRVDVVCPISLLSQDEAIRLFNKHAYNIERCVENYEKLAQLVVSYAAGLPLALKVLGSFLYDKDKDDQWMSTLARLKDIPDSEIVEKLKISYDGLTIFEKEIFLDIACFFRGWQIDEIMVMLDACGFHPSIGVKVLRQKGLVTILGGRVDMHDLVQEMGHYIVRGEHPYNPEKHSRVWKKKDINNMRLGDPTMANDKTEALIYGGHSSHVPKLVSTMKNLRLLWWHTGVSTSQAPTFLSEELRYIDISGVPLPENFHPTKLVVLKLRHSLQTELWKGYKSLSHLKELNISDMLNVRHTPDFGGLPCLERLTLHGCFDLEEIHPSFGHHTSLVSVHVTDCYNLRKFPAIIQMKKLVTLNISSCIHLREFPEIKANMNSLVQLSLYNVGIQLLPSSIGRYCTNLISIRLSYCKDLKSMEGSFHGLRKHLLKFEFGGETQIEKLPKHLFDENCCLQELSFLNVHGPVVPWGFPRLPHSLKKLSFSGFKLKDGEMPSDIGVLSSLQELDLSGNDFSRLDFSLSQLTCLKRLNLSGCENLGELQELPSSLSVFHAEYCTSLWVYGDLFSHCKWLSEVSLGWKSDRDRILQTMLQGELVENHSMILKVEGTEILKLFKRYLVGGTRCKLQLAENWYNDFSGFLIFAAWKGSHYFHNLKMTLQQDLDGSALGMDSPNEVVWEDIDKKTWVMYVSFGSLRNTAWWDQTSTAVSFSLNLPFGTTYPGQPNEAIGVLLVPKKQSIETTEPNDNNIEQKFRIYHDSKDALKIEFRESMQ